MQRRLVRCVPQLDFMAGEPPTFLYTSGRPNRCNPRGVNCLYFSETEITASSEYRRQWLGTAAEHQPKLTFSARVSLRRVLDLENQLVRRKLALCEEDLFGPWRLASPLSRLQQLGLAVSQQRSITAIRFPSMAARRFGQVGWNVVIFPRVVGLPDRVEILGSSDEPLEVLS